MTRHLAHFAHDCLPTRTVRVVRGREIREMEMGSGTLREWLVGMTWPTEAEWERLVNER